MQQPQEWKSDESRGPSIAKVFAVLAIAGIVIVVVVAIVS